MLFIIPSFDLINKYNKQFDFCIYLKQIIEFIDLNFKCQAFYLKIYHINNNENLKDIPI